MKERNVSNFDIVIFGITGNLSRKKLIPSIFNLYKNRYIFNFRIIGFSRKVFTYDEFKNYIKDSLWQENINNLIEEFLKCFHYISGYFNEKDPYSNLYSLLKSDRSIMYYLSTSPEFYKEIINKIKEFKLNNISENTKIVLEKPFGNSFEAVKALNLLLYHSFKEDQIYRIDHYLGKETVQNILTLRFGNLIFENIWNNCYIDFVQITIAEESGIDGRAEYYDSVGALKDMVQNHILQLISLIAMEPPISFNSKFIHNEKVKVLKSLKRIEQDELEKFIVKGQYVGSNVEGVFRKGYKDEAKFLLNSCTETYLAMKIFINNFKWSGVPFYIRTGKSLSRKFSEIYIHFKRPSFNIFNIDSSNLTNALVFRIQPRDGIEIKFNTKKPGCNYKLHSVNMDFSFYSIYKKLFKDSYERLLIDAFLNDNTLYASREEIESSWEFISDILNKWQNLKVYDYIYGSEGPFEASSILEKDHFWRKI